MKYYSIYKNANPQLIASCISSYSFKEALFMGPAPDGGLLMPENIPVFNDAQIKAMRNLSMDELACELLEPFTSPDIPRNALRGICKKAFNIPIPLEDWNENIFLARLDRGPSSSFKDFAARFLSALMDYFQEEEQKVSVLVCTSGDTGGAIAEAFSQMKEIQVCILYPGNEVSPQQKQQLNAVRENVLSVEVDDKFDVCQQLVKQAFSDPELKAFNLTSANSINIARVLAQMVYYFYLYFRVAKFPEEIVYSIPSGNLGNALACELARRMGLPVNRIVLACNSNDAIPHFLNSGDYMPIVPSRQSISNAMNVGHPSNLARFVYLYFGCLSKDGRLLRVPDLVGMRNRLWAMSVSDKETEEMIRYSKKEKNILLDPHGAVGLFAAECYFNIYEKRRCVVLQTAHPNKFSGLLKQILGNDYCENANEFSVPPRYKISGNYSEFKNLLKHKWNG